MSSKFNLIAAFAVLSTSMFVQAGTYVGIEELGNGRISSYDSQFHKKTQLTLGAEIFPWIHLPKIDTYGSKNPCKIAEQNAISRGMSFCLSRFETCVQKNEIVNDDGKMCFVTVFIKGT